MNVRGSSEWFAGFSLTQTGDGRMRSLGIVGFDIARGGRLWLALASAVVMFATSGTRVLAEHPVTTVTTVIDRVQIEDMLYEYYAHIDHRDVDYGEYYVADGVLDVNGLVARGTDAIKALYRKTYAQSPTGSQAKEHILVSNPRIVVNGTTATADSIYTFVVNDNLKSKPRLTEQGRDHDELVKRGERWYLKSRTITSDSGLSGIFVAPYKER
jgi:hypothetical protein